MLLVMTDLESNVKNVEADELENLHLNGLRLCVSVAALPA